jgi:hypothetical protein
MAFFDVHDALTDLSHRLHEVGRGEEAEEVMWYPFRFMAQPDAALGFVDVPGEQRRARAWVDTGGWQTVLRFRKRNTGGGFREPFGAEIRVRYGLPRLGFNRQVRHLDGDEKRVWVRFGPPLFAYLQMKVPYSGYVTWGYVGAPGKVPDGPVRHLSLVPPSRDAGEHAAVQEP